MNRQIKFRGRDIYDKNLIYGEYAVLKTSKPTICFIKEYANGTWHFLTYEVYPDTVAQLIATDRNGYEVYEGDPIRLADGWRTTATFRHFGAIADGDATLITEE